MSAKTPCRVR